jgi:EAL domain-containing protein (putative c-di-GMP-specific phosphodiesterase class I)
MMKYTLMQQILGENGISVLFQPIYAMVNGTASIFALEALARGPKGSNVEPANVLFEYVRRKGKEVDVDRACVAAVLKAAATIALPARSVVPRPSISINVHAATLEQDDHFAHYLFDECARNGIDIGRVILEIVEQQQYWDSVRFFHTIDALRSAGVRIALDDIGLGYSNYRTLIEVRPDFYKIDRYFVTGSKTKDNARAAIESIVLLAQRLCGRAIAEGIESTDDLDSVRELGIDLVQGFHLAVPQPASALIHKTNAEEIAV